MRQFWLAALIVLFMTACGNGYLPKLGYPWVENVSFSIVDENLRIEVIKKRVRVVATYLIVGIPPRRDFRLSFPIPPPGSPVTHLGATLLQANGQTVPLSVSESHSSIHPFGEIVSLFTIWVSHSSIHGEQFKLKVEYNQPITCGFRYTMKTGAYWRGPIKSMRVLVSDPLNQIVEARVEGESSHQIEENNFIWHFKEFEPAGGILIKLTCGIGENHND